MGAKGLNQFLTKNWRKSLIKRYSNLGNYSRETGVTRVGVDVYLFLHKLLYSNGNHVIGFLNLTIKFLENKIVPVFIFDGKAPIEKKKTIENRRKKREKLRERIKKMKGKRVSKRESQKIKSLENKSKSIRDYHLIDLKHMFNLLNIPYLTAIGEADALFAKLYYSKQIDACFSEDTDILIYGCRRMIKFDRGKVVEYDLYHILRELDISREQFIDMAILLGCDYSKQLPITESSPTLIYNLIKKHGSIEKLVEYLGQEKYLDLLENYYKARAIYLDSGKNEVSNLSTDILDQIKIDKIENYLQKLSQENYISLSRSKFIQKKNSLKSINELIRKNYFITI